MNNFKRTAALLAAISLTACSHGAGVSETETSVVSDENVRSEETAQAIIGPETEEISYMERYSDIIEEMPRDGITEKREGVTYPEFQRLTYYSTTAERDTPVNVLLPLSYSEEKKYPVLYILHGYYGNEDWMAGDIVGVSAMLTNLCEDGEAEKMIVVLPYIYCSKDMPYCTKMDLQNSLNYDNFINDLTTDLMPFIEQSFSVAEGRENTAITGFSMGGRESLFIGFSRPELFGYIGAVCPAPGLTPVEGSADHPGQMEESEMVFGDALPYALLLSAAANDGVVGAYPSDYHNAMDTNNTEHIWHIMQSTGHDHTSVTPHLYNFMRLIFKGGTK